MPSPSRAPEKVTETAETINPALINPQSLGSHLDSLCIGSEKPH